MLGPRSILYFLEPIMDFNVGAVLGLLRRTMPFLVFRFLIYFGITLAYVLATGAGMGIGYVIGTIGDDPGAFSVWGGLFGFGAVSAVVYFLREYLPHRPLARPPALRRQDRQRIQKRPRAKQRRSNANFP